MSGISSAKFNVVKFDGSRNFSLWQGRVKDLSVQQGMVSRPKTHSKGVTVNLHLKPEGLKYNLTQTIIL